MFGRLTVSKQITRYVLLLLSAILIVGGILLYYYSNVNAQQRTVSRLNVSFEVLEAQLQERMSSIETYLSTAANFGRLSSLMENEDINALSSYVDALVQHEDEYLVFVDRNGKVLGSNAHIAGTSWELSDILQHLTADSEPLYSYEALYRLDSGSVTEAFMGQISLSGSSTTKAPALIRSVIVPITNDDQLIGAAIGGLILNNNAELAANYTNSVPNTYLSIADSKGIRVCSNIQSAQSENFFYPEGTEQNEELIRTTNSGVRWEGIEKMPDPNTRRNSGIVVADPLFNSKGEVIGNIGVGSPIFEASELSNAYIFLTCLIAVLLFIVTAFLLHVLSESLTSPIGQIQEYSQAVAASSSNVEKPVWNMREVPVEYLELTENIGIMAEKLTAENQLLEDKVASRTAQMKSVILELEESNRAKAQFLANCTHELKTPMNAIIGFTSLLEDGEAGPLNEDQISYLKVISDSSDHLLNLINDLLTFVRQNNQKEKLAPEILNVRELFESFVKSFVPKAKGKRQDLSLEMDDEYAELSACWDAQKVRQVFMNLINNAIQNTPEGGWIILRLRMEGEGTCLIEVEDNGVGISDDKKEAVFRVFEQLNPDEPHKQGLGLGLAIAKKYVEMHEGRIWIEDANIQGTIVKVLLPLQPSVTVPPVQTSEGEDHE